MVENGDTSDFAHDRALVKRWAERINNPPSVQDHIQFFIDSAQSRLQVARHEQDGKAEFEMRALIREAETALQHFEAGEINKAIIAYDHMHEHRAKYSLPLFESIAQQKRAQGKTGKFGPVRKILTWLDMNSPENTDIFERWRKTLEIIETGNGEKWSLESQRIMWTEDSGGSVKPEDYEYFYADRSGEDPEDDDVQIVEIPVTVGNIKIALSRIRKEI